MCYFVYFVEYRLFGFVMFMLCNFSLFCFSFFVLRCDKIGKSLGMIREVKWWMDGKN